MKVLSENMLINVKIKKIIDKSLGITDISTYIVVRDNSYKTNKQKTNKMKNSNYNLNKAEEVLQNLTTENKCMIITLSYSDYIEENEEKVKEINKDTLHKIIEFYIGSIDLLEFKVLINRV